MWVTTAVGTSPMCRVSGATRAATSTASSRPRTWSVRSSGAPGVVGLQAEGVLDGDEVEQAALGLGDEVGPVAGGEQLARAGRRARARRRGASRRRRGRRRGGGRTLPCPAQPAAPAADSAFTASICTAGWRESGTGQVARPSGTRHRQRGFSARRARRPVAARSAATTLPPSADSAGHSAAARIATRRAISQPRRTQRYGSALRNARGRATCSRPLSTLDEHVSRQLRRSPAASSNAAGASSRGRGVRRVPPASGAGAPRLPDPIGRNRSHAQNLRARHPGHRRGGRRPRRPGPGHPRPTDARRPWPTFADPGSR